MQGDELKESFLELLEKDPEFRYTVAGYIGLEDVRSSMKRLEDAVARLIEVQARNEEMFARIGEEIRYLIKETNALREVTNRLVEEIDVLRRDMQKAITRLDIRISALEARYGMIEESAVRNALKGIIGKELGYSMMEWSVYDDEGYVYGYANNVQLDVIIRDGKIILLEIASHVKRSDPITLKRKADLYRRIEGRDVSRLMFVTPLIDDDAREACSRLGIEVYTA